MPFEDEQSSHPSSSVSPVVADLRNAPVNALGYFRVMFVVDDINETLDRLHKRGAQLVGEVARYQDSYRLCCIRGCFSTDLPVIG